ncbi:MAG: hypothetical protein JNK48_17280 [Bryobacterales bacterium]|nr:hypothetical protein [Bryobacterales bacterium]
MQRLQCSLICDGVRCYVIAESNAEGGLDFFIQEPGEVRWHSFQPAPAEREAVQHLLASGPSTGWPLLHHPSMARK